MAQLVNYSIGAANANWYISANCSQKFVQMSTKCAAEVNGTQIQLSEGYVSRYDLIRNLVEIDIATAQNALAGTLQADSIIANVRDKSKNLDVADTNWKSLEDAYNQVNFPNVYKTKGHWLLVDNIPLCTGGTDSAGVRTGYRPNEDSRRTGKIVKIRTMQNTDVMANPTVADWIVKNSPTYGFYFIGDDPDTFLFLDNPVQLNNTTVNAFQTYGWKAFLYLAAIKRVIPQYDNRDVNTIIKNMFDKNSYTQADQAIQVFHDYMQSYMNDQNLGANNGVGNNQLWAAKTAKVENKLWLLGTDRYS